MSEEGGVYSGGCQAGYQTPPLPHAPLLTHTYISLLHDGSTHALIHPFQNVLTPPAPHPCILLPQMARLEAPPPKPPLTVGFFSNGVNSPDLLQQRSLGVLIYL